MTYREKIQQMIATMESIYDDCEWLRDLATDEEKKAWNDTRRLFYCDAQKPLKNLDDSLSQARASMIIKN